MRARFEKMIAELQAWKAIDVEKAELGPPTDPSVMETWRKVAGAAWPDGMTELYREVSSVDVEWRVKDGKARGGVHIPPVEQIWDYAKLDGELWFDFLGENHPFHKIRPIDRFANEAYAVLYPVPSDKPSHVAYHYCGEELFELGLTYQQWLELLLKTRGALYWMTFLLGPAKGKGDWVEEGVELVAKKFKDFDPAALRPKKKLPEVELPEPEEP